jgi:hypothetical protein
MKKYANQIYEENKLFLQFVGILVALFYVYYFATRFSDVHITVKKDDMIKTNGRYNSNMIGTTDGRVFKVSTNPLVFAFTASEILNELEEGVTYNVSGYGRRVPMLGLYPQITKIHRTSKFT